jgi:hypothetical protein
VGGPSNGWTFNVTTTGALQWIAFNAGASDSNNTADGVITANTWTHVTAVRDGSGNLYIYKNGVNVLTATVSANVNTAGALRIGSAGGTTQWWGGRICMVSIWSGTALSDSLVSRLIYLDKVDLPTPKTWSRTRSITSVINQWLISGVTTTDTTSRNLYGLRTWDVDDSTELSGDVYSADLMNIMETPRPIITASFDVLDSSSVLPTIAPLDVAEYEGDLFQVLDVRHDISPETWEVSLVLDRTRNDMTDGSPLLPA